jgi:hypothetical protein
MLIAFELIYVNWRFKNSKLIDTAIDSQTKPFDFDDMLVK